MDDKIVTLISYHDPMLAEIVRGRLQANGIDCFIADDNTIWANPLLTQAVGGVKIKVFEKDIKKCREILSQTPEVETDDELSREAKLICPNCGSTNVRYGAATLRRTNWITAIISFLLMVYPFYARKAWHCFNCGKDFEK
jgi:ribosomal protein L37AE/L43A